MTQTPEQKIEEAKGHLHAAKENLSEATHEKVAEKIAEVGGKIKEGIDHVIEKVTPEAPAK